MVSLRVVKSEFFGNHDMPFSSLEILTSDKCLTGISGSQTRAEFFLLFECFAYREMMRGNTCLRELVICNCPSLESFPKEHKHQTLESLHVSECRNLDRFWDEHVTWHCRARKHLHIESSCCDSLSSFPLSLFTALHDLHILECNLDSLSVLPQLLWNLQNLRHREIKGCQNLESLPGQGFPNSLASLSISDCPLPVPLCQRDTGAYWDLIPGLQRLEIDGEDIYHLKLKNNENHARLQQQMLLCTSPHRE